jgi:multiple antibiotic resistance protein
VIETFLSVLLILFLLINPIGLTPVFLALTSGTPDEYKQKMAIKSTFIAWFILVIFAFAGNSVLTALGISLEAFRVGGGLLLTSTGFRMVLEHRQQRNKEKAQQHHATSLEDISVFPIATLFIAGPGAITALLLMMNDYGSTLAGQLIIVAAITLIVSMVTAVFLLSGKLSKFMPETITSVISRVLGILLISLGVQFVFDGILATFY